MDSLGYCSLAPTNLLTTRVGPCSKPKGLPVAVSEMSVYTRIYDSSITGRFNVTEPIDNGWQVKATMLKCQDIRNLDTCDYFKTYPVIKTGCSDHDSPEDQDLYSMFFHHITPRISCPVQPGEYKIMAYPFFTEDNYRAVSEAKISTSIFGYTYKLEGLLGERLLFCVEAYLQLLYVREHNWMNGALPPDGLGVMADNDPADTGDAGDDDDATGDDAPEDDEAPGDTDDDGEGDTS